MELDVTDCNKKISTYRRSYINVRVGLSYRPLKHMSQVSQKMPLLERYCVLLFDELALRPNINIILARNSVEGLQDFSNSRMFIALNS